MPSYSRICCAGFGQFVLVVFIGVNIAFFVTHATPIDPVEQTISATTSFGSTSPEAIALMRQSLRDLYGLQGGLWHQYLAFWQRVGSADFGPSLSAFPTPVSVLILPCPALDRGAADHRHTDRPGRSAICWAGWPAITATAGCCALAGVVPWGCIRSRTTSWRSCC